MMMTDLLKNKISKFSCLNSSYSLKNKLETLQNDKKFKKCQASQTGEQTWSFCVHGGSGVPSGRASRYSLSSG